MVRGMAIYQIAVRVEADTLAHAQVRVSSIDAALQPLHGVTRMPALVEISAPPAEPVDHAALAEDEAWAEWVARNQDQGAS